MTFLWVGWIAGWVGGLNMYMVLAMNRNCKWRRFRHDIVWWIDTYVITRQLFWIKQNKWNSSIQVAELIGFNMRTHSTAKIYLFRLPTVWFSHVISNTNIYLTHGMYFSKISSNLSKNSWRLLNFYAVFTCFGIKLCWSVVSKCVCVCNCVSGWYRQLQPRLQTHNGMCIRRRGPATELWRKALLTPRSTAGIFQLSIEDWMVLPCDKR